MKRLILLSFLVVSSSVLLRAQLFEPDGYLLGVDTPLRVTKSHIVNDSLILNAISVPVDLFDNELKLLISSMYRTVTDSMSLGVGIAAPQVGVNKRVILVKRVDRINQPFDAYLNPAIIQYSDLKESRSEGCLSVDNFRCEVERSYAILVTYFTVYGDYRIEMVEGYTARIFQHEIDHLDGILFTERAIPKE